MLLCAANDNALCQMALAYRHFLGADGLHQDCDVAIGRISSRIIIITLDYAKSAGLKIDQCSYFLIGNFCESGKSLGL